MTKKTVTSAAWLFDFIFSQSVYRFGWLCCEKLKICHVQGVGV
jgi:hypothetical protein